MESRRPFADTGFFLPLVATFILAWSTCPAADDPVLGLPVPDFYAVNEPAVSGMLRFGRQSSIPMGIVLSKELCSATLGHLQINHVTGKAALDQLASSLPQYAWRVEGGTVVFLPMDLSGATAHFLSLDVSPYSVPEDTLQAQAAYGWMNIRASLRPDEGTAFSVLSSTKSRRWPPLRLGAATVREVLDRLVSRKPGGAWILLPINSLENAAENRPFQLIDYSGPTEGAAPCSGLSVAGD